MQNIRILLLLFLTLTSAAVQAEEFYVELGRTNHDQEAKDIWIALQQKYGFLNDYDVYPNKILQLGGDFSYRVQAGPMLDKREATAVCQKLFAHKVPRYVIEGFDPKNTPSFADVAPAPVISDAGSTEEIAVAKEEPLNLPWLDHLSAPPSRASSEGRVVVAEAIAVPLTEEDNQVTIEESVTVITAPAVEASPSVFGTWSRREGWISVQPFLDESRAQKFWQTVRSQSPEATGLTVQTIHPVVSHDVPKVILSIGQFASEEDAMAFCRNYVSASKVLECEFVSEPPQGQSAGNVPSQKLASDEYSLFWVEILKDKDQDTLLEKWERIRTDNDDVLADIRSQITTSLSSPGIYVVRIGPLKTRSKAARLCKTIKDRGLACELVSL